MSHDHGKVCECVARHAPAPLELHVHHILPLAMGGLDVADNRVWLCPTTHTNVHELLRVMLRVGPLTWGECVAQWDQQMSRYAYHLAHEGLRRFRNLSPVATDHEPFPG